MSELLINGLENWFRALPVTVPLFLTIAVFIWRRDQRR